MLRRRRARLPSYHAHRFAPLKHVERLQVTEAETRDYAIVLTFFCVGLSVSELCDLNLQETDLDRGNTWIKGKGRREKELVPLPASVVEALRRYLKRRGPVAGPLFLTRGNRGKNRDGRLETRSVLRIVRELDQRVGLHVWCHDHRGTRRRSQERHRA